MAKYTMQLRRACEIYTREEVEKWFKDYDISHYLTQTQIETIEKAGLWNKDRLASKIVDHYYMREIGAETPYLFKHYAKVTMQELMESKLPLIYSNSIQYDPLVNVDFTETFERDYSGDSEANGTLNSKANSQSNSESNSETLGITNNTPQTRITKQNLDSGIYASTVSQSDNKSNITDTTDTSNEQTTTSNQNSSSTEKYSKNVKGNSGVSATAQKMVEQFRDNIVAIDKEIIENLSILFMGIY